MNDRSGTRKTLSLSNCGIGHVGLRVSSLKKSCKFYQEKLGLPVEIKNSRTAYVHSGPDVIVLFEDGSESSGFHFGFRLESPSQVDKWHELLESRKVSVYQDIRDKGHPRSFKIRDPDGYFVEISSAK